MSPYLQVLKSYTTRNTLWFILLLYIGMFYQVYYSLTHQPVDSSVQIGYPQMFNWWGHSYTLDENELAKKNIDPESIVRVTVQDPYQIFKLTDKNKLQAIKHVNIPIQVELTQLQQILEAHQLETLCLFTINNFTFRELSDLLATQPNLKFFSITNLVHDVKTKEPPEDLVLPETLEKLVLMDVRGTSLQMLEHVCSLPRLKELAINLYPSSVKSSLDDKQLELIRSCKTLQRLFLSEVENAYPHLVHNTQAALPEIWVRPNYYKKNLLQNAGSILGLSIIPPLALIVQLSGQFLLFYASMIPGFIRRHLVIGLLLYLPFIIAGYVLTRLIPISPDAAISMILFPIIPVGFYTLVICKSSGYTLYVQPLILFPGIMFTSFISIMLILHTPLELTWWLRGERFDLSVYLILLELLAMAFLALELINLNRKSLAKGTLGISLNIYDFKSFQEWSVKVTQHSNESSYRKYMLSFFDNPLNNVINNKQKNFSPAQMWQASSQLSMWNPITYMYLLIFLSPFALGQFYFKGINNESIIFCLSVYFVPLIFGGIFNPIIMLLQRRSTMTLEFLRPYSRHELLTAIRQALLHELTPSFAAAFLLVIIAFSVYHPHLLLYALLFFMIGIVLIYYLILLLVTFRYVAMILLISYPLMMLTLPLFVWVSGEDSVNAFFVSLNTHTGLCLLALIMSMITYLIQQWANSRWQNLEPAKLVRS